MLRVFSEEIRIGRKDFFTVILLFNVLEWFYMMSSWINSVLNSPNLTYTQNLLIWASYYAAIIGSSIVGSILSKRISRIDFLYLWMIIGIVISLSPVLLSNFTLIHILIICILLGASFGVGMPSCLAYFADCTLVENRGLMSGIILLTTNLIASFFAIVFTMFNLMVYLTIFATWKAFGLIIFYLMPKEKHASEKKDPSFISILHDKNFFLYFIAWLMFCLIDGFEWPILREFLADFHSFTIILGPIIGSFSAFVAGLLCDLVGRKRMVLYGFITLGIAYAVIGVAPATSFSWFFYLVFGSISSGILWVVFILILWGDLSQSGAGEKYYVIGEIPYFLTGIAQLLSASYVMLNPEAGAFSLASFFLFLAVLPLLYAPETLPEKKIELRRLRKYVEKARKVKEKHEEKDVKG